MVSVVVMFTSSVAVAGFSVLVGLASGVVTVGVTSVRASGKAVNIGSTNDSNNSTTGLLLEESGRSITSSVGAATCSSTRLMGSIISAGRFSLSKLAALLVNWLGGSAPKPPVAIIVVVTVIISVNCTRFGCIWRGLVVLVSFLLRAGSLPGIGYNFIFISDCFKACTAWTNNLKRLALKGSPAGM